MFRTRDFVLLFSTIMFLVLAIGTTLLTQNRTAGTIAVLFEPQLESEVTYPATIAIADQLNRAERVADMRAKISQEAFVYEPAPEVVVATNPATSTEESTDVVTTGAVECATYQPYLGFWDARGLTLTLAAGTRTLTRATAATSSSLEVVLQLPIGSQPSGNPTCLQSDVIGIANDGSLIRNDEVALYSIFGAETVIGYALDGFPIYGAGAGAADACSGRLVAGQYRYEIQRGSATIINCFVAPPVTLP
jgi:hypothetical protein